MSLPPTSLPGATLTGRPGPARPGPGRGDGQYRGGGQRRAAACGGAPGRRAVPADFGLLRAAAVLDTRGAAQATRARLASAGIRATVGVTAGRYQVPVFEAEVERARRLVGGHL